MSCALATHRFDCDRNIIKLSKNALGKPQVKVVLIHVRQRAEVVKLISLAWSLARQAIENLQIGVLEGYWVLVQELTLCASQENRQRIHVQPNCIAT